MAKNHIDKRLAVTAAVDVIAGNADLLSEILLRLPARSLIKFTLVCKLWFSIINSMQFRWLQIYIGDAIKVTQSCNGLMMCVISSKTEVFELKLGIVYNSAKNEYHKLPNPYVMYYEVVYGYNLIFDPSEPPYYKALCIKRLGTTFKGHFFGTSDFEVSVYVPGNESLRSCCRFSPPYGMRFDSGVFWNSGIHWIGEYSVYVDAKSEKSL
ncbi:F-box protein At5g07610-like [Nicotiana tabacum]|uniref:F-box protein At5g07610-like n=1 Tax=Nicotiana tabacum TaxID=4097 RepID=A0AC58SIH6_TOBAC